MMEHDGQPDSEKRRQGKMRREERKEEISGNERRGEANKKTAGRRMEERVEGKKKREICEETRWRKERKDVMRR